MKPKQVNWQYIDQNEGSEPYVILNDLMATYHGDIQGAIILLMWRHNWKFDPENYIQLSDISKTADKYRELREHHFVIGLNKEIWEVLDDNQKKAIIDSQLDRIAVAMDKEGNPKEDDRSRIIYRLKRIEASADNISRRYNTTLREIIDHIAARVAKD